MSRLLDRMPFVGEPDEVVVRGERVRVRANQIILWASLTLRRTESPNPTAVPFPVVLDTGHTHSLSIHERHLIEWAGLRPDMLVSRMAVRERGRRVPLRDANIWVHPNVRGRATHSRTARRNSSRPNGELPSTRRATSRASRSLVWVLSRRTP